MNLFTTKWTTSQEQAIEGQMTHHLPLIKCPYCENHRGNTSMAYPWINLKRLFDSATEKRLRFGRTRIRGTDPTDFTWTEFQNLRDRIRQSLASDYPLPPGADFGIFQGKIYAKPPASDFVMPYGTRLLARRRVVQRLNELGYNLRFFEVKLQQQKGRNDDFVQVWAPPVGISGPSSQNKMCSHCERGSGRILFIIQRPVVVDAHLFVLKDALSPLIFTEKLVRDIQDNGFAGLAFEEAPCE